jgi:hypothetical protein
MKGKARLLSAALLIALAPVARAETAGEVDTQVSTLNTTTANRGQTQVATRIASSFTSLTGGSQDESLALVNALRNGTSVTLTNPTTSTTTGTGTTTTTTTTGTTTTTTGTGTTGTTGTTTSTTTITPPTGKMGWGEVFISLALAKAELSNLGITNPTPEQLQAALDGGTITKADGTTVAVKGVLEMRADGMGWGQIAHAEGTKLGPVVSSIKSEHQKLASLPTTTSGTTDTDKSTTSKSSTTKGVTTAAGSTAPGSGSGKGHKGIVSATGSSSATVGSGHSSKGITTASGVSSLSSSHGITTAEGSIGAVGPGHSSAGRGLVTAAGGSATGLSTAGTHTSHTSGVVTGAGSSMSGVTTAQGAGGNGDGNGHGRGKGGG